MDARRVPAGSGAGGGRPRFARILLLAGGGLLVAGGIAGLVAGAAVPDRLYALLPPLVIDAAAVGGATVALSAAILVGGAVELSVGFRLGRAPWAASAALIVLAVTGALLLAIGVALLTEVAAGASAWLAVPGMVLVATAAAHGVAAWRLATWRLATASGRSGEAPEEAR